MFEITIQRRRAIPRLNLALLAMLGAAACWGMGTVLAKSALETLPPFTLATVELTTSSALLFALLLRNRDQRRLARTHWQHAAPGFLEPGIVSLLTASGLALTSAGNGVLISATEPVLLAGAAWLLLRQRPARRVMPVLAAAVIGTILIGLNSAGDGGANSLAGDLLVLLGAGFAALHTLVTRGSLTHLPPLVVAALQQGAGLLLALAMLPAEWASGVNLAAVPLTSWLAAMLSGLLQCALGFLLYLYALKRMPAISASLILTAIPVFGLGGAALLLGEPILPLQAFGGGLIVVALVAMRGHDEPAPFPVARPASGHEHIQIPV